jgi:GNAT superfamily N-acetyltransferase
VEWEVEQVAPSATWQLRHDVLRPHEAIDQLALPDDLASSTVSFAAVSETGEVIGTAQVLRADAPFPVAAYASADSPTWRLQGMATREDVRDLGIGSDVMRQVTQYVAEHGGGLLWCNARVPAANFYRRAGFVEHGDIWVDPDIGPHVVMWRMVQAATNR